MRRNGTGIRGRNELNVGYVLPVRVEKSIKASHATNVSSEKLPDLILVSQRDGKNSIGCLNPKTGNVTTLEIALKLGLMHPLTISFQSLDSQVENMILRTSAGQRGK